HRLGAAAPPGDSQVRPSGLLQRSPTLLVPADDPPPPPTRPPHPPHAPRPAAAIPFVEDDRSMRDVLRFALVSGGWEVSLAENAQHGLTQLAAARPDAGVLDAGLADMDGLTP